MGTGAWPDEVTTVTAAQAGLIGGLLLFAAAGKSALLPFCGWLPRAMEGPTPSSAVFYGALSVHLGAFLLLRVSSLFACSLVLAVATVALGLGTAAYATFVGRVQTDIKSALSFASLIQVGIIDAEIGAGHWVPFLWYVALVHLLGHACLRTLQFVRAPSLLLDYRSVENAIGGKLPRPSGQTPFPVPVVAVPVGPGSRRTGRRPDRFHSPAFVLLFRTFTRWETRWTDWLNGRSRETTAAVGVGPAGREALPPVSQQHPLPTDDDSTNLEARR